jgi:hypothetical protein
MKTGEVGRKKLNFNEKTPMIVGMWTKAPGGAAWTQKRHVGSKWFFLITDVSDVKLFGKEKSYNLAFAFLEIDQQTHDNDGY